jgi:uracil DNA glycosylase
MGKQAQAYTKCIKENINYVYLTEHPAAASYGKREWKHEDIFNKINKQMRKTNNIDIDWWWLPF